MIAIIRVQQTDTNQEAHEPLMLVFMPYGLWPLKTRSSLTVICRADAVYPVSTAWVADERNAGDASSSDHGSSTGRETAAMERP